MPSGDPPRCPSAASAGDDLEEILERFEIAWRLGSPPCLEEYLPTSADMRRRVLIELVHSDLECRLKAGLPARVESYLERFPDLADDRSVVLGLIQAEYKFRCRWESDLSPQEFFHRFPLFTEDLHSILSEPVPGNQVVHPGAATLTAEAVQAWPLVPGYEILGELGRGGMGVVYKARQLGLNRLVAVKVILHDEYAGPEARHRFQAEAEAVARLSHPNIVQVYEVGEHKGRPFLSLEFCPQGSLDTKLAGTPLPAEQAAQLTRTLAGAVQAAHQAQVIHRDLKPANVLLSADGIPKVTDFGLAKMQDEVGQTASGLVIGSPSYMAPEQARGKAREVGPAADVYALGAILYECLTGRPPFKAATSFETLQQVVEQDPVPPRQFQPRVPLDLETICLTCPADWRLGRAIRWARRQPAQAALLLLSGLMSVATVVLVVGAVYNTELRQARDREELQRQRAEANLEKANQYLYFNRVGLAERAWSANSIGRARELLAECPAELRGWEWHYLDRLCHPELLTLAGHDDEVLCVAVSPDGKLLASGGKDRAVRLWDARTGRALSRLPHSAEVWGVAFHPDGKRLASASGQMGKRAEVIVWELTDTGGRELYKRPGLTGTHGSVTFSPKGDRFAVASGTVAGEAGKVTVFDTRDGQPLFSPPSIPGGSAAVAFTPDGKRLAAAVGNTTLTGDQVKHAAIVWNAYSGKELGRCEGHSRAVTALSFSPDGKALVTASCDQTVRIWDADTFRELRVLRGHKAIVRAVSFRGDGRALASGGEDGMVRVWDVASGEELFGLRGHTADVYSLTYTPDGSRLVSCGMDRVLHVWDATTSQEARVLHHHDGPVQGLAFSSDGRWLASNGGDRTVRVWDRKAGGKPRIVGRHATGVWCVAFSPDSRLLASGAGDSSRKGEVGEVAVWDVVTGRERFRRNAAPCVVWSVAFSSDGALLAAGGGEISAGPGEVLVWDLDGRELHRLSQPRGVWQVTFRPGSRDLAGTVSENGLLKVWSSPGQEKFGLLVPSCRLWSAVYSPEGHRLFAGGSDGATRVWDALAGERCDVQMRGHLSDVVSLAISPDGRRLATTGWDQTVKIWDTETGQELITLRGHNGPVWRVDFSPDGQHLASCSDDGTIRIWNAEPRR